MTLIKQKYAQISSDVMSKSDAKKRVLNGRIFQLINQQNRS
jgi:hypothetical protein